MPPEEKRKEIPLSYYRRTYDNGSWYQSDAAEELGVEGKDVLIADRPTDEELHGLRIAVYEDKWIPEHANIPVPTGLHQVHLMGDSLALNALGRYLIAISESELPEDKIDHIEPIKGADHKDQVHLVVHHTFRENFRDTIRVGSSLETHTCDDSDVE